MRNFDLVQLDAQRRLILVGRIHYWQNFKTKSILLSLVLFQQHQAGVLAFDGYSLDNLLYLVKM